MGYKINVEEKRRHQAKASRKLIASLGGLKEENSCEYKQNTLYKNLKVLIKCLKKKALSCAIIKTKFPPISSVMWC